MREVRKLKSEVLREPLKKSITAKKIGSLGMSDKKLSAKPVISLGGLFSFNEDRRHSVAFEKRKDLMAQQNGNLVSPRHASPTKCSARSGSELKTPKLDIKLNDQVKIKAELDAKKQNDTVTSKSRKVFSSMNKASNKVAPFNEKKLAASIEFTKQEA